MPLHLCFSDYMQCIFPYYYLTLQLTSFFATVMDRHIVCSHDPSFQVFIPQGIPLSLGVDKIYDLLLAKRIWQGEGAVTSMITLHKKVTDLTRRLSLAGFEEAGSHFGMTKSQEQFFANNQLNIQALSLTAHRKLKAANNHLSLKVDPSQAKPQMRLQTQLTTDCSLVIT